jgi:hypothetical protein
MTTRTALFWMLAISIVTGAMGGYASSRHAAQPLAGGYVLEVLFSFVSFVWYRSDRDARAYVRSRWLSVAMVGASIVTVPYYLWRSRPRGQRRGAILRFSGFVVLLVTLFAAGSVLGVLAA